MREKFLTGVPRRQANRSYGLGVDIHQEFGAVCIVVPCGTEIIRIEFEMKTDPVALLSAKKRVLRELRKLGVAVEDFSYAVESTATFHYPLIRNWQGNPCIVNPAIASSFKARKTDKIDAFKLATLHQNGVFAPSFMPSEASEILRSLCRSRKRLISYRTRLSNAIGTRLTQWYCPLGSKSPRNNLIKAAIEDLAQGKYQADLPEFAQWQKVPPLIWQLLVRYYGLIDDVKVEIDWLEKTIANTVQGELASNLATVPGVGPLTVAIWIAEVEPTSRFPTVNHCIAYCGLDPTPQISAGKKVGTQLRLGNSHIRTALVQAAQVLLNGSSALAQKFKGLRRTRNVAKAIAARHLAALMYRFSLKGEKYDEKKVRAGSSTAVGDGGDTRGGDPGRSSTQRDGATSLEEGT